MCLTACKAPLAEGQLHGCRFDFPAPWEELLSHLRAGASWRGPASMRDKQRSLFTLKNVVRALRGKRFVIEPSLSQDVDVIISPHGKPAFLHALSVTPCPTDSCNSPPSPSFLICGPLALWDSANELQDADTAFGK